MPAPLIPILFIVFAFIAIIAGIAGHRAEVRRRGALAALAAELGWRFTPDKDPHHDEEYAHFELFRRGHSRCAFNTLQGLLEIDGRPYGAKTGDFTYKVTRQTGKTTSTTTYRFSYLIVDLPFPRVPDLLIRREGVMDRFAAVFGMDDIDFESAEFSRRFFVKCPDKRFAYDVIHPRMMEFLMRTDPGCVDIERGRCCVSDGNSRWPPERFRDGIDWVRRFFDLWPDYLAADLDARHGER